MKGWQFAVRWLPPGHLSYRILTIKIELNTITKNFHGIDKCIINGGMEFKCSFADPGAKYIQAISNVFFIM